MTYLTDTLLYSNYNSLIIRYSDGFQNNNKFIIVKSTKDLFTLKYMLYLYILFKFSKIQCLF